MLKVSVFIHSQVVMMVSAPWSRKRKSGRRLTKNADFTAALTWVSAHSWGRGWGVRVVKTGKVRIRRMQIKLVVIIIGVVYIASTWICTKSFWFLRPTDELLSFRSWVK